MSPPLGIAILGSGIFVAEQHRPGVEACELVKLVAVYSRSRASVENVFGDVTGKGVDLYSDDSGKGSNLEDLLARKDIQAVIIALPILVQPEIIKKCLLAGKHVLSEKPIAPDLKSAQELLDWYARTFPEGKPQPVWAVAENFRFMEAYIYARKTIEKMGRLLTFSVNAGNYVPLGGKYFETPWRKTPSYQGGFLLDGGVHQTAGILALLPPITTDPITKISAFTTQLQPHLPPVDTVSATMRLKSGVVGYFSSSFGSTVKGLEFVVGAEKGSVQVGVKGKVTVKDADGNVIEVKEFTEDGTGVKQEIRGFAESLLKEGAKVDERQRPELAYNDLALIETMLQSGEKDGLPLEIQFKV